MGRCCCFPWVPPATLLPPTRLQKLFARAPGSGFMLSSASSAPLPAGNASLTAWTGINIPDRLWPFCVIGVHDTSDQKPFLNLGDSDRWEINSALGLIAPAGRGCGGAMNSFPALR